MTGALDGIRVLDMGRVLAAPFCGMILADMGAEVIKIEIPRRGDDSRAFGPFVKGESGYFMNVNRNKKGVTLNLKGEGKELFKKLVQKADIVIENFRPGVMEKLGLGYEELKKINPGIIYGCISGFGHTGPYSQRPGYDVIGQASSGLMSVTGWPEGEPTRVGTAIADTLAGYSLTIGILAAVNHKRNTGKGQKVDIALMDSCVASMQIIYPLYTMGGQIPKRIGNRYESNYPTDTFRVRDGNMVIGAANDKLWKSLCIAMENPQLAEDSRYDTNPKRVEKYAEIKPIIQRWIETKTLAEAMELLTEHGVPAMPIHNLADVVSDPQTQARELFVDIEHPIAGMTKLNNSHIKMSETMPGVHSPAPGLGEHNAEIFSELLGLEEEEIISYKEQGII